LIEHTWRRGILTAIVVSALALVAAGPAAAETPPVGTTASEVDLEAVPGATPYGLGYAVPLKGESPDWYTAELHERVLAADGQPVQAPPDAPLPGTVGIRPGGWMIFPAGCTMNFIFEDGNRLAIGTAGHCAEGNEEVTLLTLAPGTENPVLVDIGRVVKSIDGGIGNDFALVEIRPELHEWVSPTTAVVAGPCGQYFDSGPETVAHYGHGIGIGTAGTPRAGVALKWETNEYGWFGAAIFGDSGSPVRVTDLSAAGNLTHLIVHPNWLPNFIAGTRIGRMEQIAGGFTMVSSSLCPGGSGGSPGDQGGSQTEEQNGNQGKAGERGQGRGHAYGRNRD
jgi:hypothetical protein